MNIKQKYSYAEEIIGYERDHLADLLVQLRDRIPSELIDDQNWCNLLRCTREIPSTVAAFPFGFELPMHTAVPSADLGITLVGGSASASAFRKRRQATRATPTEAGLAWLIQNADTEDSAIFEVVDRQFMLGYDIADNRRAPGIFLKPAKPPLRGSEGRSCNVSSVIDTIVAAAGWERNPDERRHAVGIYDAMDHSTTLETFNVYPSRQRYLRLLTIGFQDSSDVLEFLERLGWSAQQDKVIESTIDPFKQHNTFANLGLYLDVRADGVDSMLGLTFNARQKVAKDPSYWVDQPQQWDSFLNCLRESDLVDSKKLQALSSWQTEPELFFCKSGMLVYVQGIHHFKIVLRENRIDEVKAYVYCLFYPGPAP